MSRTASQAVDGRERGHQIWVAPVEAEAVARPQRDLAGRSVNLGKCADAIDLELEDEASLRQSRHLRCSASLGEHEAWTHVKS